jgi:hypothetical protein
MSRLTCPGPFRAAIVTIETTSRVVNRRELRIGTRVHTIHCRGAIVTKRS